MLVSDNQQVTSSWFVGILEGEGSFRNSAKSNIEVRISNTNTDIIEACESFLRTNYIYFVTTNAKRITRKREYTISIRKSREILYNYPRLLFDLIESKMQCRKTEYQKYLEPQRLHAIYPQILIG
jgi:DNA-binding transcriptional regulator WhiA